MIYLYWSPSPIRLGIGIQCQRWYDGLTLATRLFGDRPASWEEVKDEDEVDYEVRWVGSAAQSADNLQMQFRKAGARKWTTM